jgi:hypothetical protein
MRGIARIERAIIEDAFPNEDYHKNRLRIIERNLGALAPIIQAREAAYRLHGQPRYYQRQR